MKPQYIILTNKTTPFHREIQCLRKAALIRCH